MLVSEEIEEKNCHGHLFLVVHFVPPSQRFKSLANDVYANILGCYVACGVLTLFLYLHSVMAMVCFNSSEGKTNKITAQIELKLRGF